MIKIIIAGGNKAMRFTLSTQPLKNATDLGIIKSNISKLYYRSGLIQLMIVDNKLKMNIEATGIKTTMLLNGSSSGEGDNGIIIDCTVFKKLIDSIESDVMTLEINPGNLTISAGTSKFTIPQVLDINEVQLVEPISEYNGTSEIVINPTDWKFVSEHQSFAIASLDNCNYPVYTNIYVGDNHEVITGDYEKRSWFTRSTKGNFDGTCLLTPSLVNLFTSIPDGSKIIKVDKEYILNISTDAYEIITEFTPKYEDDPAVGSYNADVIREKLNHPDTGITISVAPVLKFINQISLLSQNVYDNLLSFTVKDCALTVSNTSNEYSATVDSDDEFTVNLQLDFVKSILSNFDADDISFSKLERDGKIIGLIFWSENLTMLLAATKG